VFIRPVNFAFLQDFYSMTKSWWYMPIEPHCKCTVTLQKWENINKWTWWNQHNEWWKGTTITARPSRVHQASQFCISAGFSSMSNFLWHLAPKKVTFDFDFWLPMKSYCKWTNHIPYAQVKTFFFKW
jgi:hypothetical protein